MWQQHLKICLWLFLISIPIAIFDFVLLKPGSGGWISLNFRGLLIGAYGLFVVTHIIISSILVNSIKSTSLSALHLISTLIAVIIIAIGIKIFSVVQDSRDRKQYEAHQAFKESIRDNINLISWRFNEASDSASEIILNILANTDGRFATNISGYTDVDEVNRDWYFNSNSPEQRMVKKGESFDYTVSLKRQKPGKAATIDITIYLFGAPSGPSKFDVTKIYSNNPEQNMGGDFFYEELPTEATPQ